MGVKGIKLYNATPATFNHKNATEWLHSLLLEGFPNFGYRFGGPHNKDCSIVGSIIGSPYFGKLPPPLKVPVHLSSRSKCVKGIRRGGIQVHAATTLDAPSYCKARCNHEGLGFRVRGLGLRVEGLG